MKIIKFKFVISMIGIALQLVFSLIAENYAGIIKDVSVVLLEAECIIFILLWQRE